ncbi:LytR/AlgR family response regulator transcription factor [Methylophilus sp. UBA6697]|jgi:two-component system response regulator AlgR|uniref:LytR/AlgR family response regulator transcription factor n=1 Tax=Methylophilus sp. UBA6697 TaxID=1946902 RepID=UPI000ED872BF|nr:response regulator transcription factor [Methylophilus sp. UBA6697]HCU85069.1 DNA-binding response regulator [Methylophilus sp.]
MASQRLLIVDDEPLARQRLRDLVGDVGGYEIAGEAANGVEAISILQEASVDIVLVDIRMPMMDGIELAQHLRGLSQPPKLIFTTAYDHYAVQAFELNAIDYLLKPIRSERLAAALAKAQPLQAAQSQALRPLQETHDHLSIHERGKVLLVAIADVLYLRAELKYVTVRTRDKSYLLETSLNQLEQIYAAQFVRIHRNALVARAAISGFEKQRISEGEEAGETAWVVLIKGIPETLLVSRRHQHVIKAT